MNTYDLFYLVSIISFISAFLLMLYTIFQESEEVYKTQIIIFLVLIIAWVINFIVTLMDVENLIYSTLNYFTAGILFLGSILFMIATFKRMGVFIDNSRVR
ncbi:MAG: hypothetical protein [Siphoviridae sp. ctjeG17]|nr:MAG: hypothetical protein [Siphoviridae sp. ctjeG17]